jgi:hypothetical protein
MWNILATSGWIFMEILIGTLLKSVENSEVWLKPDKNN